MEHTRNVCELQFIMLYPKRLIAKLANLYRRLIMSDRNVREAKLNVERPRPEITVLLAGGDEQRGGGANVDAANGGSNLSIIIVDSDEGEISRSELPDKANLTIQSHSDDDDDNDSTSVMDEGPILETGISRKAFCIQLDTLLQRNLGMTMDTVPSRTSSKGGRGNRKR